MLVVDVSGLLGINTLRYIEVFLVSQSFLQLVCVLIYAVPLGPLSFYKQSATLGEDQPVPLLK